MDISFLTQSEVANLGFSSVGQNVLISRAAGIIGAHNISIGCNVRIDAFSLLTASEGYINIRNNVHIASYCSLVGRGGVVLKDFSGLSHGVRIFSASDDYSGAFLTNPTVSQTSTNVQVALVELNEHVIVGANTVILPGVTIGEGSAIGAQSLVTKTLGEWGIYSGAPARLIRVRSKELLKFVP
jgi:galactoside O-acetyltransferase